MDPTVFPVAAYSLTSDTVTRCSCAISHSINYCRALSAIDGVAHIGIQGGEQAEYRVDVDPAQLQAYGLALDDVVKVLSAANVLQAVGRLEDHYKLFLMLSDTRLQNLADIRRHGHS